VWAQLGVRHVCVDPPGVLARNSGSPPRRGVGRGGRGALVGAAPALNEDVPLPRPTAPDAMRSAGREKVRSRKRRLFARMRLAAARRTLTVHDEIPLPSKRDR